MQEDSPHKTFNICLVGAGRIGRIHAGNLRISPRLRLKYVCDIDSESAERLAAAMACEAAPIQAALDDADVEGVVIASSTDSHHELIADCIERRLPILCEKPLDLDFGRASESAELARQAGVPLFLGFNRRFDPSFSRIHHEIRSGRFGPVEVLSIVSRDPSPPPLDYVKRSGGIFKDMMIHDLDMAIWLLGETPTEIFASGECHIDKDIEEAGDVDTATVSLRAPSGALCQITNSRRCAYGYDQRVEAFCANGMIRADNESETRVEVGTREGFVREPAHPFFLERYGEAYRRELAAFADALEGKKTSLATGEEALQSLALAEAAERSLRTRRAEVPEL
jgi:myo-inositol 2-dehydrogenase/D-chiro-inositol 1-dehydrogenase